MRPNVTLLAAALAVAAALAAAAPGALAQSAARWFPLEEDDVWEFAGPSGKTHAIECVYDDGGAMSYVYGLRRDGLGAWFSYSYSAPMSLYVWNRDAYRWQPMFRFGYRYTPWTFAFSDELCNAFQGRRARTDFTVQTPAGTFTGCNRINFAVRTPPTALVLCAPHIESMTLSPGVGPVEIQIQGESYKLARAKVGATSYPQTSSGMLVANVTTDRTSYTNLENTIRCITWPCPSNEKTATANVTFTITNGTGAAQTFQFTNGCQFDVQIIDAASGQTVAALSDNQFCTMALTAFTLQPGQAKAFTASLELEDRNGAQLGERLPAPARSYFVRASLANTMQGSAWVDPAQTTISVSIDPHNTTAPNP